MANKLWHALLSPKSAFVINALLWLCAIAEFNELKTEVQRVREALIVNRILEPKK